MCGILAVVGLDPQHEKLNLSLDRLSARGPDGRRWLQWDSDGVMAHTHLHIVGRQLQPLTVGALTLAHNGEFYDFGDHPHDGHYFLEQWRRHGAEALGRVEGEFALLLWDGEALWGARDPFGVKPLQYHLGAGHLVAASEAKAILPWLSSTRWDLSSLLDAAALQYPLPDRTFFQGVRQLPPGHYFRYREGRLEVRAYRQRRRLLAFPEALERAVKRRLQGDHPLCVQLSGGIDSASVAALAEVPTAFTVTLEDDPFDESLQARQIARHLGLDWRPLRLSRTDLEEALEAAVAHAEGPAINAHLPAKYLLHRTVRAHGFRVVLTGEGADEVLFGYPHFRQREVQAALPQGPSTATMQMSEAAIPLPFWVPNFFHIKARMGQRILSLLHPDLGCVKVEEVMRKWTGGLQGGLVQSRDLWCRSALAQYILKTLGDGTESAHGLEGRTPFLDGEVVEAARHWKPDLDKGLLRRALAGRLPSSVLGRPKKPFILKPWVKSEFLEAILRDSELVDPGALARAPRDLYWAPALMWLATLTLLGRSYGLR